MASNNLSYKSFLSIKIKLLKFQCVDHLAGNDFCIYYSLALEDIVLQFKPSEFSKKYTLDLLNLREKE